MRVEEMLGKVSVRRSSVPPETDLRDVTCDSRTVGPGDLFVAVRGERADGLDYLARAVSAGAGAVLVGPGRYREAAARLAEAGAGEPGRPVGVMEVEDEREALALLGRNVQGRPDLEMRVIGITGTNGKTTTAWLLASMLEAGGIPCGLMGTVEYRFGGLRREAERTTPEGPEIHRWLRKMRDGGAGACAMEISSHSLELKRVAGIRFAAAVFTNLTRDHLDYHGDMDRYYAAKRKLFENLEEGRPAVINADDPRGGDLAGRTPGRPVLFGRGEGADFRMTRCQTSLDGTEMVVETAWGESEEILSPLVGIPNATNILAAAAAARSLEVSWEAIRAGTETTRAIPGRLERVDRGQPFAVLVDYAHTDDALRNVLEALRPLTPGRLITVFGCGGDRDRTKRPLMGAHAARLSDLFWVTSDNPRSEDPGAIIEMVLEGVRQVGGSGGDCRVEPDRAKAIQAAVAEGRAGDTVLIAGKGHERVQIGAGGALPFDDVEAAREALGHWLAVDGGPNGMDGGGETS